jgi:hypothetical protein
MDSPVLHNRVSPVAEHVRMYVVDPYQYIALFALYLVIIYSLTLGYSAELDKDAEKQDSYYRMFSHSNLSPKSARGAGTQT